MLHHPLSEALFLYPLYPDQVPPGTLVTNRYTVRFASNKKDLVAIQQLRFDVFNVELNKGLKSSWATRLDHDEYESRCHHIMVTANDTGEVVGTYRLMTSELSSHGGFYSDGEFDISQIPTSILEQAVETGRACVHKKHRQGLVIHLLWRGLARYMDWNSKRYVFGCCSLPGLDVPQAWITRDQLKASGHWSSDFDIDVRPRLQSARPPTLAIDESAESEKIPSLFTSYLKMRAKVYGGPAFDHEFNVTDYLVMLDTERMDPQVRRSIFSSIYWLADE